MPQIKLSLSPNSSNSTSSCSNSCIRNEKTLIIAENTRVMTAYQKFKQTIFFPLHIVLHHSVVSDSAKLWTVVSQAPLSLGFSKHKYWSGLPFPSPGHLPNPGIKAASPELAGSFFTTEPSGKFPFFLLYVS